MRGENRWNTVISDVGPLRVSNETLVLSAQVLNIWNGGKGIASSSGEALYDRAYVSPNINSVWL
jgi:hypothetical protein